MTTVSTIVSQALEDADIIGEGETASGDTGDRALNLLNQMLALWQADNVFVYCQQVVTFSPSGALSYTIGTGQTVDTARPEKIDAMWWRSGDIDYPVRMLETFEQYQAIPGKTEAGEPLYAFYVPSSYTTGTLYLYPQPSSGTIRMVTQLRLPQPANLAATLELPPEYMFPIRTNLAVMLRSVYGGPIHPGQAAMAVNSLRVLKRNNLRISPLPMHDAIPSRARSDIFAG